MIAAAMQQSNTEEIRPLVLVVDDDDMLRILVRGALELAGFAVEEASGGRAGLSAFDRLEPAMVLLDVIMPDLDGFSVCAELRGRPAGELVPVLMMTGLDDIDSINRAYEAGATDFITKPINWAMLGHRARYILRSSHAVAELARSERRNRALLNAIPDLMIQIGRDGAIRNVKEADGLAALLHATDRTEEVSRAPGKAQERPTDRTEEVSGAPGKAQERPTDFLGRSVDEVLPEELGRQLLKAVAESFRTGDDQRFEQEIKRERTISRYEARVALSGDDDVFAILRDVTREAELERQLHQSQKLEALGALAGGVAHDFNNLIMIIQGYADMMLMELALDPLLWEMAEQIRMAGQRAAGLTRQLLAFSRRQVLEPETLDLNFLVTELAKMLGRLLGEDVFLVQDLKPEIWPVYVDSGQIEQVLMNLVINARDAMPRGGTITIRTTNVDVGAEDIQAYPGLRPGPHALLSVTDTGVGMDEATMARIFEPFFTTKEVGKGTGLGLATVDGIVKQSNGNLRVASELGHGTTFSVYLPRSESAGELQAADNNASSGTLQGDETILIVEDDAGLRAFLKRCLGAAGYTILEAGDGVAALKIVGQHPGPLHLVLSDVIMPGMSGPEVVKTLREERPDLAALYISGYPASMLAPHGVLEPGVHFLTKPFNKTDLQRKVRAVIQL